MPSSGGLISALIAGLMGFFDGIVDAFKEGFGEIVRIVVSFLIRTPNPNNWSTLSPPTNDPWEGIFYVYHGDMLPLAFVIFAGVLGSLLFMGMFQSFLTNYERTHLERRAFVGLLLTLGWWWIGSITLAFSDGLAMAVAGDAGNTLSKDLPTILATGASGVILGLVVYLVGFAVVAAIVLIYTIRIIALYAYMLGMPILIMLWVVDIGPFRYLSGLASGLASYFVPIAFMTLPTAFLVRISTLFITDGAINLGGSIFDGALSGLVSAVMALGVFVVALIVPKIMLDQTSNWRTIAQGMPTQFKTGRKEQLQAGVQRNVLRTSEVTRGGAQRLGHSMVESAAKHHYGSEPTMTSLARAGGSRFKGVAQGLGNSTRGTLAKPLTTSRSAYNRIEARRQELRSKYRDH